MRISTQQIFLSNIDNISQSNANLFKIQNQLSTGKRIQQPSDDPLASAQIQKFKKEIARTEQYISNIDVSKRRLQLEEDTIEKINNQSIRLRELAIKGKNGTLNDSDRKSIASEVGEIVKSLQGLMNTKDVQGEYLFSGNKGFTESYSFNQATKRYEFNGDDGQRFLQVGPSNRVASTDSGFDIFEKVPRVPGYIKTNITQTVPIVTKVDMDDGDKEKFGEFMAEKGPLKVVVNAGRISVTDKNGDFVTAEKPPVALNNYDPATNSDAPTIKIAGMEIDFSATTDGTSTLDVFDQHNILNTANDLKETLETANLKTDKGKEKFAESMDFILKNLEGVEDLNVRARASIGGRVNTLDRQLDVNEEYKLFTEKARSSFEDLDFSEAISRFKLQETALQAAYSSFAKIQDLNLFNFLR